MKPQILTLEFLGMNSFHIWTDKGKNFYKKEGKIAVTIADEETVKRMRDEGTNLNPKSKYETVVNTGEKFEINLDEFRKAREWKPEKGKKDKKDKKRKEVKIKK